MSSCHETSKELAVIKTEAQKSSQVTKIGIVCLLLLTIGFIATFFFDVSFGTLLFAAMALACPLLHVWMMKNGGHKH